MSPVTKSPHVSLILLSQKCSDALEGMKSVVVMSEMPVPALVVEVVSPGEPRSDHPNRDYVEKLKEYAARGIPEFWQVDPDRAVVTVLTLKDEAYQSREFRGSDDHIASVAFPALQLTAR